VSFLQKLLMKKNKRINNLNRTEGILAQMRRVYRQVRADNDQPLSVDDGLKLSRILHIISTTYRDYELEKRIEILEDELTK
jgi:hypothetical protein